MTRSTGPRRFGTSPARIALGVAALAGLIYLGGRLGAYVPRFAGWVDGLGPIGPVAFIAGYALGVVAFVPGSVLTLAAGAIFGVLEGTAYVFVAATLGATGAFLVCRYLARRAVERRLQGNQRFAAIDRAIGAEGRKIVFLLRLSPVFPFNLLNYALGLTRVRLADYVVASLGMIPGTLLYVYSGKLAGEVAAVAGGADVERGAGYFAVLGLGFIATVAVTVAVTRIARRALEDATEGSSVPAEGAGRRPDDPAPATAPLVLPRDQHNESLVANVHPPDWVNPTPDGRYNLVVIGAGTAGLISALLASSLGARVALIERHLMGGDCLNTGCVPSKALIRAGRRVHEARAAAALGLRLPEGELPDFGAAMERMREIRARISREDSAARYRDEFGIDVYLGRARFTGEETIDVEGVELRFKKAVIATGARPMAPPPRSGGGGYPRQRDGLLADRAPARLAVIGRGRSAADGATLPSSGQVAVLERGDSSSGARTATPPRSGERLLREGIRVVLEVPDPQRGEEGRRSSSRDSPRPRRGGSSSADLVGAGRAPTCRTSASRGRAWATTSGSVKWTIGCAPRTAGSTPPATSAWRGSSPTRRTPPRSWWCRTRSSAAAGSSRPW
jgi:uncharacterized membrane protein YdjX (TVP38/TMEM64 family)